jgi:sugar lactone lactonase YvrE
MKLSRKFLWLARVAVAVAITSGSVARAQHNVIVPGTRDFPESITSTADGTLFMSSMAGGRIFRAAPGATEAAEWIKPGTNGLLSVLGVLADEKTNTVYACSPDMSWAGIKIPAGQPPGALKTFDLKTGAPKASFPLPDPHLLGQTSLCNDIAVGPDGSAYVTDSLNAQILRLKPGAKELEVWATDDRWKVKGPQLDGIAVLNDGNVYANIFEGNGLYRVQMRPDGSPGTVTKLNTSLPLYHSDGLRPYGGDKLLMVEGEGVGRLDLITISGNDAKIDVVRGGFLGPVSVTPVGNIAYVMDTPLKYLFEADYKTKTPPPFTAYAVKLPSAQ